MINKKTYCAMPWVSASLMASGALAPCCSWEGLERFSKLSTLSEYLKSKELTQLKQDMISGKTISNCMTCYREEDLGIESRRLQSLKMYGVVTTENLQSIEIDGSNICNLKCRGCSSAASHLWYDDEIKLYGEAISPKKYFPMHPIDDIDFSNIVNLKLAGGEPFLDKQLEIFLNTLLEKDLVRNINVDISTNTTVPPSSIVKNVLLNVKSLKLNCSIDGLNDLNEYFRSGAKWDQCLEQFERYNDLLTTRGNRHTQINIHTTVSIYNVNLLDTIRDFFTENFPHFFQTHRILYWPACISIKYMPVELKNKIKPIIKSLGPDYSDVLQELNNTSEDMFEHFLNFHDGLDKIRNEKLGASNTMLSEYIRDYKVKNPTRIDSREYFTKHINFFKK
jgi:organic radical activating enzyme